MEERLHEQLQVKSGVFRPHIINLLTTSASMQWNDKHTILPGDSSYKNQHKSIKKDDKQLHKTMHMLSNISLLSKCAVKSFPRHQSHTTFIAYITTP